MKIIVLTRGLQAKHKAMIEDCAAKADAKVCFAESEAEVPAEFGDAEVVYGFGMQIAKTNKNLKWLCVPSAGVDYLMKPGTFANENCLLTNSSGAYGVSIAEHMIAVSLMMMRNLTGFYAESLHGNWSRPVPQKSLKNSRITVLGTGDIGSSFARRAKAFEPKKLIGVCRSGRSTETVYDAVLPIGELDAVLPETDLLAMSLPDTPETKRILSKERIALLPKGAYVVNVGRGSAIDEEALADSLNAGHLAGAALDVFQTEPLPKESRLWSTKNLLITPHVAGNLTVAYTLDKNVEMFCEDLLRYAEGKPLSHLVDRTKGY